MDFIISHNQLHVIVEQNLPNDITDNLRRLYDFTRELIDKSISIWDLNAKFLVTWGAALGGMILPLKNWLEGQNLDISQEQIFLLLLGIACNYYYDNSDFIRKVMQKIKDEALLEIFKNLYLKSEELKKALGTGGALEDREIVLQGDRRETAKAWLIKQGYTTNL